MVVEAREIESEAAALAGSGIGEITQIDVGLLGEPVDGAVDAEQRRVEEVFLTGDGDARRGVVCAVFFTEALVHFVIGFLVLFDIENRFVVIDADEHLDGFVFAAHVVRPAAVAGRGNAETDGILFLRRSVFRDGEVAIDAAVVGGREADPPEIEGALRTFWQQCLLHVFGNGFVELFNGVGPEGVEIIRGGAAFFNFFRFEADAPRTSRCVFRREAEAEKARLG